MASRSELAFKESRQHQAYDDEIAAAGEQRFARPSLPTYEDGQEQTLLAYADIVMDLNALRVERAGKYIQLRPTEFRLLRLLLEQPERAFTREQLKASVWGHGVKLDPRSINTYLGRLRRALTSRGESNVIRTITGFGYSLDATCPDLR